MASYLYLFWLAGQTCTSLVPRLMLLKVTELKFLLGGKIAIWSTSLSTATVLLVMSLLHVLTQFHTVDVASPLNSKVDSNRLTVILHPLTTQAHYINIVHNYLFKAATCLYIAAKKCWSHGNHYKQVSLYN